MSEGAARLSNAELGRLMAAEWDAEPLDRVFSSFLSEFAVRYKIRDSHAKQIAYKQGVKKAADAKKRAAAMSSTDPVVRAEAFFPHLEPDQRLFLEYFRDSGDRVDSAIRVGRPWREIEASLDSDQKFQEAFLEVDRERTVRLEDRQVRSAMEGKNAAQQKMALEARSAVYAKKKGSQSVHLPRASAPLSKFNAESEWGRIFGDTEQQRKQEEPKRDAADPSGTDGDSGTVDELASAGFS